MTLYSYIVCRRDMNASYQAVQSAHAAMEMGFRCTQVPASPVHIVLLGISNQDELLKLSDKLQKAGVRFELFYEPDYNTGYTALCTYPSEDKVKALGRLDLL
jgi:hypothetical protein